MPSEVSMSGAGNDREPTVEELKRELAEARDQQTATSEVLSVISSSPGELGPVFEAMLANAVRICGAKFGNLWLREGNGFRLRATHGAPQAYRDYFQREPVVANPDPRSGLGQILAHKRPIHIEDIASAPGFRDEMRRATIELAKARSLVGVPMLKEGEVIGCLAVYAQEVRQFSEKQVQLLQSFASQAVIAIENTRLLTDLRESLQQQTATADVLKVVSRSAFDLQAVLDTLVRSAASLCEADGAAIHRRAGDVYPFAASYGHSREFEASMRDRSFSPGRESAIGRAVLGAVTAHIPDVEADPADSAVVQQWRKIGGYRTTLAVPLMREDSVIGAIVLTRKVVRPFTNKQIELVETFADQAVIAIENTRLFEEVQARTHDLSESLEYQTAISDVLSVISKSPSELQPVLNAIVETARRLCSAPDVVINLQDGDRLVLRAHWGTIPIRTEWPISRDFVAGRCVVDALPVHVHDFAAAGDEFPHGRTDPIELGHRTMLATPLLKENRAIGALILRRAEVRPFTDREIRLVETFANQAVIAIENARLFEEVQARTSELTEALERQTATSDVLNVMSRSAFHLQPVLDTIVETASRLCEAEFALIFRPVDGKYHVAASNNASAAYIRYASEHPLPGRGSLVGRTALERRTVHLPDCLADPDFTANEYQALGKYRTMLGVPLLREGVPIGVITLLRTVVRPFTDRQIELVTTFADQAVIAIENVRLFEEFAQKSRELEIASQHKSQFVANMSHELRTPLAAMLGYAELLQEGIYGAPPEKFLPILTRIRSNGKHLLGLINTVLDISKIEAGQFKLNLAEYALGSIVETVMVATESLAATKKLGFKTEVAKGLPYGLGDEQRLTQVLLNLVGNAIKFTDAGEVRIAAGAANGHFTVSVSDTGPGIPAEECERIFEKFRQVDSSNTRAKGGTGLGLAIAREIVEMHGGRIWVESTIGEGSTLRMELPVRAAAAPVEHE
jgi:signal transduction histidine kinase